jgi:hypothetical protein
MWVHEVPRVSPLVPDLLTGRPTWKLDRSSLLPGVGAELLAQSPTSDWYRFTSDQAFSARFPTFCFPGWEATLDGNPVVLKITDPHGLIEVPIPTGEQELRLRFVEPHCGSSAPGSPCCRWPARPCFSCSGRGGARSGRHPQELRGPRPVCSSQYRWCFRRSCSWPRSSWSIPT